MDGLVRRFEGNKSLGILSLDESGVRQPRIPSSSRTRSEGNERQDRTRSVFLLQRQVMYNGYDVDVLNACLR